MKRSRWSSFNNTHQSHYTMTESNRSLPPAYFNLLYTQWVSCHVSTQSTRWRQPAPWCYRPPRSCQGPWSCWAPWRDHTANRLQFAIQEILLHSVYLRNMPAVQFGIFSKKEVNLRKVVYLVLVVLLMIQILQKIKIILIITIITITHLLEQ